MSTRHKTVAQITFLRLFYLTEGKVSLFTEHKGQTRDTKKPEPTFLGSVWQIERPPYARLFQDLT